MWTMNFQMFKLDLEKAEEPEIKSPTSVGSLKKREFQKNIYFCFIDYPMDVGTLISGSSVFSKFSLNVWKFMVHVLLKPGLENFEHYFTSVWDECNCAGVWAFFGISFLWDWDENWPFLVLRLLLSFPNLLAYWVQNFHSIVFQYLKELHWNSITSTSFDCSSQEYPNQASYHLAYSKLSKLLVKEHLYNLWLLVASRSGKQMSSAVSLCM